ncbi:MAG: cyclic pyranopterin monophosphate synthase MoaC [Nitrospinae bacterium]|nr:cyclic pyranopterin monophosphate synthase MoaC [Nitrospinota bacterium]
MSMADVSGKTPTRRTAVATGVVKMGAQTLSALKDGTIPKGDVLGAARLAGVMAAKKTQELIPLCHQIAMDFCSVEFDFIPGGVGVKATASAFAPTGVEMEALTAVTVAALTIYDMCKPVDKTMVITDVILAEKHGGKSGDFVRAKKDIEDSEIELRR